MARIALLACILVLAVVAPVAGILAGSNGWHSAALGWVIVVGFFWIGHLAVRWAVGLPGGGPLAGAVTTFWLQITAVLLALMALRGAAWVHRGWFAGTALATVVVWQVAQTTGYMRARQPIYGEHSYPPGAQPLGGP